MYRSQPSPNNLLATQFRKFSVIKNLFKRGSKRPKPKLAVCTIKATDLLFIQVNASAGKKDFDGDDINTVGEKCKDYTPEMLELALKGQIQIYGPARPQEKDDPDEFLAVEIFAYLVFAVLPLVGLVCWLCGVFA